MKPLHYVKALSSAHFTNMSYIPEKCAWYVILYFDIFTFETGSQSDDVFKFLTDFHNIQ